MTIRMEHSQGLAVLQLLKWGPSGFEHKLSDYREGFISPTREQLLLLSYQNEALLLPLDTGNFPSRNMSQGLPNQSSLAFCSGTSREANSLDSKDDTPCTSDSAVGSDSDSSGVHKSTRTSYSFLSGVNSQAWGICGDSCSKPDNDSFRDLLFISNGHQVVVHAFRQRDKTVEKDTSVSEDQSKQGRWVEWGPASTSVQNMEAEGFFGLSSEVTDANMAVNKAHENGEEAEHLCTENVVHESSAGIASKKWLCSFSTKAETAESDGKLWTRFPERGSFPNSAEVVSFRLFGSDSSLLNFVTHGSLSDTVVGKSHGLSDSIGVHSCKCSRVFTNCTYSLVGFVLSLVDSFFNDPEDDAKRTSTKAVLVVASLHCEGIKWVSSVKLKESFEAEPLAEWTDFCFSNNLLVCLGKHGLIYFYASLSGEFVAQIDILQASGLNPQPYILGQDRANVRMFKKLLVASHTTLIAAVDGCGLIYVICAGKYLPDEHNPRDRLPPYFRNSELGMFVGWEVGSMDIGCQRIFLASAFKRGGNRSSFNDSKLDLLRSIQQLGHSGKGMQEALRSHRFSAASKTGIHHFGDTEANAHPIREVFLPTKRFGENVNICFSALGITQFLRRHNLDSQRSNQLLHLSLRKNTTICDDELLNSKSKLCSLEEKIEAFVGEAVGCNFQGSLYLVTEIGISVVLPSISVSPNFLPVETIGYRPQNMKSECSSHVQGTLCVAEPSQPFSPWKVEILDRIILHEGPEVADGLCLQNGWNLKVSRLRRLQLALDYLKFDEIKQSLEMLMDLNLAEEGILRLLFAAVYLMSLGNGNDVEVSAASRLLALATSFTTQIIRNDGLHEHNKGVYNSNSPKMASLFSLPSVSPENVHDGMDNCQRLYNMGHFLEIVRNLQYRLGAMSKQTGQRLVDGRDGLNLPEVNSYPDESQLALVLPDAASLETLNHQELQIYESATGPSNDKLALVPSDSVDDRFNPQDPNMASLVVSSVRNNVLPLENPKEMIARWKLDNLDLKTVVKDALHSGRLPLAVLQLHLHRSKERDSDKEPPDTFGEVREIGRAIAYDLFLKGETGLAVATLQRLGEDTETCLKQLLFGTVRRSLRVQVAEEMRRYGYLETYEWKILEKIMLIERLYPSSSFWRTFHGRQNASKDVLDSPIRMSLLNSLPHSDAVVECGEIDGVVLGSWTTISENPPAAEADEDVAQAGYWAAAVVWSGAWDQRTIDRIVLDQPFLMGVHVLWESQLEYYVSHNDKDETLKLVDVIPSSVLTNGSLQITMDGPQQTPFSPYSSESPDYGNYITIEEIDAVCLDIPGVKIVRFPVSAMCSTWLRTAIELELAKKKIFLKEYWEGTAEIVGLLARIGFISSRLKNILLEDEASTDSNVLAVKPSVGTMQGLHKLVIHHCVQYNLPNLLDLYIDLHRMALDNDVLSSLIEAAGDCQWAKWLILSRIKGREYDSSFCNARTILSRNVSSDSNLGTLEINDIIHSVDDIAEGGGEMAALATLMYAPIPIQNCLCSGSVTRHGSSAQCTMENLRPTLQQFPTLQRALVAASFKQDRASNFLGLNTNNVLSSYLKWRDNVFFSSARDTSLLQMLPCWFPKSVRRLIQLYIQGPLGWQSLLGMPPGDSLFHRDIDFYIPEEEHTEISPVAWEATVQKHVQEELYGSLLEETGLGLEHHLHRGRALAAFNHVLGVRLQKLKKGEPGSSPHGQNNVQSDVQMLLAPLVSSEEALLSSASKEFGDARLKIHILTVLKSMQSKKTGSPSASDSGERSSPCSDDNNILIPLELFRVLADCEKQNNPGTALLRKAKEMSWSTLAMVASCFPEVPPLTCLTVWLEITAARETSSIKVNNITSQIADNVGAAVEATNSLPTGSEAPTCHYNRQSPKRRRLIEPISENKLPEPRDVSGVSNGVERSISQDVIAGEESKVQVGEQNSDDSGEGPVSLSKMVAVLCEQKLFLPLLRAFEMFLPACSLLPFLRALQAFSQMRLSEASAHLGSFSARIRDEPSSLQSNVRKEVHVGVQWISSTAVRAADAMLSTCPSAYEKRCLLQLLAATEFGDGGSAATYYRQLYWKINLAEPSLRKEDGLNLGNESLDDASLLEALEKNGLWEQARNWARQLGASGGAWKSAIHHVTETQAESMVAEWKEFLWDVPEERVALWGHCQTLFIRYSFPPLQAGLFFLKHAESVEKDLPAKELHELLLLSLQWLSGMITLSNPVYPLYLLREIETRVWLLAVESEAQIKSDGEFVSTASTRDPAVGHPSNMIDKTASLVSKMDGHINAMKNRSTVEKHDSRENNGMLHLKNQVADASSSAAGGSMKTKRRTKGYFHPKRSDAEEIFSSSVTSRNDLPLQDESGEKIEVSFSKWEEQIGTEEMERAVLSLLEFGQISAAKQLQHKLSPSEMPPEFVLVDACLMIAAISTPCSKVSVSMLNEDVRAVMQSYNLCTEQHLIDPIEVLESLIPIFTEGRGRGICKRIIAVVKAANVLGLYFSEAFDKQPLELLQLLSLKAQESFDEALLLVQTHSMPASSIAQILAESFLKGVLAAHRGGYMDSQMEEGPAPLLWRFADFLKWAKLCPSEPEIGHALMRLVITGQEIPHACEVELLILSHHFYKSSACLDGVDVLVALAATRVEAYVSEGDYSCLARLLTGVGNFQALYFVLGILIENGQLDLLLQKFTAAAETDSETAVAVEGFRMAVLTALKHFNPKDLDAFDMVYNHFNMKHEIGALLESRARSSSEQWFRRYYKDQNEELLEAMRYFIEAAEVYFSMDAGNKTRSACASASLVSLQIRMPDTTRWLNLSETNARRLLVEQSQFQEALIVAEAYGLNQPGEWVLVLWNQMLKPELTEAFVAEFVAVLPLQPSTLIELARFYRAEVAARGDQSQFSVWLTGGGMPAEWAKHLGRSFRCLLKVTWDLRLRVQLASIATGFMDVVDACMNALDKVPENGGPLVLRKGHGGGYLPLM
ncbi:unnamed protein product [Linum tenue]|uniref:Spatacsin C-terminal domain-containing protein n=1 Tax=Linum tenue TaxID=586396 RepID=A0AAV0REC7_9ROSI|nr:unnamed protein product [Linum tenue]